MVVTRERKRRTKLEVITAIFKYVESQYQNQGFSRENLLKATDLSKKSIDGWLNLIVFIQEQPQIIVQQFFKHYKGVIIPNSKFKHNYQFNKKQLTSRNLKCASNLFDYLINNANPVSISELARNIKLNNNSINNWLELIMFVQSKTNKEIIYSSI